MEDISVFPEVIRIGICTCDRAKEKIEELVDCFQGKLVEIHGKQCKLAAIALPADHDQAIRQHRCQIFVDWHGLLFIELWDQPWDQHYSFRIQVSDHDTFYSVPDPTPAEIIAAIVRLIERYAPTAEQLEAWFARVTARS